MSNLTRTAVPGIFKYIIVFFAGGIFLGLCADSTTRTAFAHGIINAFGIEYDNQGSELVANDVQAAIDENAAIDSALEARVTNLEGGSPNLCDPNGDGMITPQEIVDQLNSLGIFKTKNSIRNVMLNAETVAGTQVPNSILDTAKEVAAFNAIYMIPISGIQCSIAGFAQ